MLTQIYNGHILTPSGWINGGSLLFDDSRIVEIRKNSHIEPRADTAINALGMYVVPGGIELHCHGGGGCDFMEGTEEAFRTAVMAHRRHGTTAIFPTLSSASLPMIEAAAQTCDELIEDPFSGVLGLHLEGPYFNPLKAGAQMPELIRLPDPNEYEHIVEDFNCIKRWDSAPELPGVIEMGRYLTAKDVLPSIAHTAAEYDHVKEAYEAYEAGYTHATHFYNGMPGFHNVREFKHAGTVEAVYLMENMTVEMIADGIHVPPTLLKLVYHTKGVERTAMVTDALAVAASDSNKAFDPRVIIETRRPLGIGRQYRHDGPPYRYRRSPGRHPLAGCLPNGCRDPCPHHGSVRPQGFAAARQGRRYHHPGQGHQVACSILHGQDGEPQGGLKSSA